MELLDLLTSDGHPTARTKPKRDVHRDGDWHRAAHLWLIAPDGRLLLQRRAACKESWPGLWDISVAGHVAAGESAIEAVVREAGEELGLVVKAHELTHIGTLRHQAIAKPGYIENEFHDVFVRVGAVDAEAMVLDPLEVAEVALVTWEELERYERVPHPAEYALLAAFRANLSRT